MKYQQYPRLMSHVPDFLFLLQSTRPEENSPTNFATEIVHLIYANKEKCTMF